MTDLEKWLNEVEARLNAAPGKNWEFNYSLYTDAGIYINDLDTRVFVKVESPLYGQSLVDLTKFLANSRADLERAVKVIRKIQSLGIYCCDDESLGLECPAVLIARGE